MIPAQLYLRKCASKKNASVLARFFKTGPGQYGEGDCFLGVQVPKTREVAKRFVDASERDLRRLMQSRYHEDRMLGIMILVERYEQAARTGNERKRKSVCAAYLRNRKGINNWDLVDTSAPKILGDDCLRKRDATQMSRWIVSSVHWERRMAVVATLAWIRSGSNVLTFRFAKQCFKDPEDLMHKACGWMLGEAGKRDPEALRRFVKKEGSRMPRTMLRYAIEHFVKSERLRMLSESRPK